jgi:hypothetical protein
MTVPVFVQSWKKTGNNDNSISLTCGGIVGGSNHALVAIGLRWRDANASHFTAASVGGHSMTLVDFVLGTYTEADIALSVFFVLNPPAGTQNVILSGVSGHYGQMFVAEFSAVAGYGVSGGQAASSGNSIYKTLNGLSIGRSMIVAAFGTGDWWGPSYASPLSEVARNENNLVDNDYDSVFSWGYGEPTTDPQTLGVKNCASPKATLLLMELVGLSEKKQQVVWFN